MKQSKSKGKKRKNRSLDSRDGIQKINFILSQFDFQRVESVMKGLDWQYCDVLDRGHYSPNANELKEKARIVLSHAAFGEHSWASTGGFLAKRYKSGDLDLYFYVETATTESFKAEECN